MPGPVMVRALDRPGPGRGLEAAAAATRLLRLEPATPSTESGLPALTVTPAVTAVRRPQSLNSLSHVRLSGMTCDRRFVRVYHSHTGPARAVTRP